MSIAAVLTAPLCVIDKYYNIHSKTDLCEITLHYKKQNREQYSRPIYISKVNRIYARTHEYITT